MSGSLVLLDEVNVSSAVSTVEIGGNKWDSSYDIYVVEMIGVTGSADSNFEMRLLKDVSGTPTAQTTANYDRAYYVMKVTFGGGYSTDYNSNQTSNIINGARAVGTDTNEDYCAKQYLYNFNNASGYSFFSQETVFMNDINQTFGNQGTGCYTVTEAHNGCQYYFTSGNIESGIFKLYGLNS